MAHKIHIEGQAAINYVFQHCPFDGLHWDDAFALLQLKPVPLPCMKGVKYSRKELVLLDG